MIIVWVNKRNWKTPGPIVHMGVHNAHSFAASGSESHFVVGAGTESDTDRDLREFYGLDPLPHFHIHRVERAGSRFQSASASVFRHARRLVTDQARRGEVAVFTRESGFLPHLLWLKRNPRVRGFVELHDAYADLSWRKGRVRFKDRREQLLERLFLPRMDGLVCITADQRDFYRRIFPSVPSIAVPLGTKPLPGRDPEAMRKNRTVVYVGHMHGSKGVKFLSQAAVALARRGIRTLFLGGYAENIGRLTQPARDAGLGEWVEARAFLPPAEMHGLLAERASLGVAMLADTYYNRHLTCPVKALDYLSHGLPTLGTDVPSVREVLGPACAYLPEGDIDRFVQTATRWLDDPAAYSAAVAVARRRAAELTWEKRADALVRFASGGVA